MHTVDVADAPLTAVNGFMDLAMCFAGIVTAKWYIRILSVQFHDMCRIKKLELHHFSPRLRTGQLIWSKSLVPSSPRPPNDADATSSQE
jgi:hypothetical protein